MIRSIAILILALATTSVASTSKKDLKIAVNSEFDTLHPIINSTMAANSVLDATLRPLVIVTVDGTLKSVLIKQVPRTDNGGIRLLNGGKDGLIAKMEFIETAKWSDGKPVTCEDLKFAWEVGTDPNVSAPSKEEYLNIESIQVDLKQPRLCELKLKRAKWNFLVGLPRPIPAHVERPLFEKFRKESLGYDRNTNYSRNPKALGLYNGPYMVTDLKPGSHVELSVNPHFSGPAPFFKRVFFKFIPNTATLEANLLSGTVDLLSSAGLTLDQALNFEKKIKRESLPYEIQIVPATVYTHIDLNMDHPALADLKVRQALSFAINKNEMIQALFEGRQTPAHHFSSPVDEWFTEDPKDLAIFRYSPSKAKSLLDQAGWVVGTDGIRSKEGQRLSLTLLGAADNKMIQTIQTYLQQEWKKVGVEVLLKSHPPRVLFGDMIRKRKFDLALYAWVSAPNEVHRTFLHSSMIPSERNSWSGSNRTGWKNSKVDTWLDQAELEFDPSKRKQLMRQVLRAYTEEVPSIPLFYRANNAVLPKGLQGYRVSGHLFTEYLEIENWRF